MYTYWQPTLAQEHRLFAKEIAEAWGVYSTNMEQDKLHLQMVHEILALCEYEERDNPLYYQTKKGLVRTFGKETITKGFHKLITFSHQETHHMVYYNGGKRFKYRFIKTITQEDYV